MEYKNAQQVFQCISYLLSYPNKEWREGLDECIELVKGIEDKQITLSLQQFIEEILILKPNELIETYVYTFDFGKKTNLYVTYMNTGEQRERGAELIELKNTYMKAGLQVTDKELPDYLPLMLEFASITDEHNALPVLKRYEKNIAEIYKQLANNTSIYSDLFYCLLRVMRNLSVHSL